MSFELDYTELDYIRRALSVQALDAMGRDVIYNTAHDVVPLAKQAVEYYPPAISTRYIRTNTYKDSTFSEWNTINHGAGDVGASIEFGSHGAIQDGRRYDQYLKDERKQADIHRGRWLTLREDADIVMDFVDRGLEENLVKEGFR